MCVIPLTLHLRLNDSLALQRTPRPCSRSKLPFATNTLKCPGEFLPVERRARLHREKGWIHCSRECGDPKVLKVPKLDIRTRHRKAFIVFLLSHELRCMDAVYGSLPVMVASKTQRKRTDAYPCRTITAADTTGRCGQRILSLGRVNPFGTWYTERLQVHPLF